MAFKDWLNTVRQPHKLSFLHNESYHEKWSLKTTPLRLVSLIVIYSILIVFISLTIIKYTPLKYLFIAEVNVYELNQTSEENIKTLEELEERLNANEQYIQDLKLIINDSIIPFKNEENLDSLLPENYSPNFTESSADSMFRAKFEKESISNSTTTNAVNETNYGFYMNPVNGVVSASYNQQKHHYGVDIVTQKEEPIKSVSDGVVVFANWTSDNGYVILIQHNSNTISVYKHCSVLLKKVGDRVESGDVIAVVGNSGEFTDGPHLHFELWQNGFPMNPQQILSF